MEKIETLPKLAPRAADSHKGDFGRVCIIGGSVGMAGAAALAGKAALRSGAGLVTVAVPKSILPTAAALEPCYTTIPLAENAAGLISAKAAGAVLKTAKENDCVAFGPGAGIDRAVKIVLEKLLAVEDLPLVIDADGLNNLAKLGDWPRLCRAKLILTPHPGEMKRLWAGIFRDKMPTNRIELAGAFAGKCGSTVVFKGHETIVTDGSRAYVNTTGNPGMATAGTGDVLTGIIAALRGQGLSNFDAACLGVYIHGLAGDMAAGKKGQIGMVSTDIIDYVALAFKQHHDDNS